MKSFLVAASTAIVMTWTLGGTAPAATLPSVVEITCDHGATEVSTPSVVPQADGYHFVIHHAGKAAVIQFWERGGTGTGGFEFDTDFDPADVLYPYGPSKVRLACGRDFQNKKPADVQAL